MGVGECQLVVSSTSACKTTIVRLVAQECSCLLDLMEQFHIADQKDGTLEHCPELLRGP